MDTIREKTERAFGSEVRVDPSDSGTKMLPLLPNNELISNAKWLSDKNLINIEVIKSFSARVIYDLNWFNVNSVSPSLLPCAASMAYHGLLGQAEEAYNLGLVNVDLTSVPAEHLAALASWLTSKCHTFISGISGIGL